MLLWLLITTVEVLLFIVLLFVLGICYTHWSAKRRALFYYDQGFVSPQGADTFFIGHVIHFRDWMR